MIELQGLSKRFRDVVAVDALTTVVPAGTVTGFIGPNGAGKSTTLRMIAGLDHPTRGRALIGGRSYGERLFPLHDVGVLLEARSIAPGRRSVDHLRWLAKSNRIPDRRVAAVLDLCGIATIGRRRGGHLSLGMTQRLGIAAALLGDPGVLILDEPTNGLDPEGIIWIRELLRALAAEGRTVLVSSHLIAEMAEVTGRVLVIGRGRLLADCPTSKLPAVAGLHSSVVIHTPQAVQLAARLSADGASVTKSTSADLLTVVDGDPAAIASTASSLGVLVTGLTAVAPSLEQAYLALTDAATDYTGRRPNAAKTETIQ